MPPIEFHGYRNPLPVIPEKILFEELRGVPVNIMTDTTLAVGAGVLSLMPPELFDASQDGGYLWVNSKPGFGGGSIVLRVGPQAADARHPYISVKTTNAHVAVSGRGGRLLVETLAVTTTEWGRATVDNVHADHIIRLLPKLAEQVRIGSNVTAAGAILVTGPPRT